MGWLHDILYELITVNSLFFVNYQTLLRELTLDIQKEKISTIAAVQQLLAKMANRAFFNKESKK